jgi:uncharacterized membrane protein YecN with MAPEG domain
MSSQPVHHTGIPWQGQTGNIELDRMRAARRIGLSATFFCVFIDSCKTLYVRFSLVRV